MDAEAIAKGLSEAQREAALVTYDGDYRMSPTLVSLVDAGVFMELRLGRHRKIRHTPLGLAVRALLKGE